MLTMSSCAQISNLSNSIFPKPSNYPPGLPCLSISFELGKQHHSPYLNFENLTYKNMPPYVQNSIFKQIKTTFTNDSHHITAIVTVGDGKHEQCLKEVYN